MSTITKILANQEVRFDDHSRGKETRNLDNIHFHKKQNGNNKKFNNAEIRIYVNGESRWETKCPALEKEIREVLNKMSQKEKIEFVGNMGIALDKFFKDNNYISGDKQLEIRKYIVKAFFPDEYDIVKSKPFKRIFGTSFSDIEIPLSGKKYRISFLFKNKEKGSIVVKDITLTQKEK